MKTFSKRHNGPSPKETQLMLKALGYETLDELVTATIPKSLISEFKETWPALSETEYLKKASELGKKNKTFHSMIGEGYYNCITPNVILRNIFENPGWYTAYTPYQAEISQGRMEALINFQTMISDLTALPLANASLLDEGTACAEAVAMAFAKTRKKEQNKVLVEKNIFTNTLNVLKTRCESLGLELELVDASHFEVPKEAFALVLQYPDSLGHVFDPSAAFKKSKEHGLVNISVSDPLALTLLKAPGEMSVDICVGSTQRLGIPLGFGGPHAAYLSCTKDFQRLIPGRIIGVSIDKEGQPAYRLSLQTREQHIRREKATSNICTSQVLLAVMAGMYGVYHGPEQLKIIAKDIHNKTQKMATALEAAGYQVVNKSYFDSLTLTGGPLNADQVHELARAHEFNFRVIDEKHWGLSFDEATSEDQIKTLHQFLKLDKTELPKDVSFSNELKRTSDFMTHPVFHKYHSETAMLRYMKHLENKDLSLAHSMIPLGSCTMKLNATAEMIPVTDPHWGSLHPLCPADQHQGYLEMIHDLEDKLKTITGFSAVSFQPNSGSQGEYAGLLVIKNYLESKKQSHRNICLIPSSAHGTNPASAVMAGMKVVVVACDDQGNIDLDDLKTKIETHKEHLAALMVTYPSTHGVFEESIRSICSQIHEAGGQVYLDGANMNALVGLVQVCDLGADVAHMNLHKTFCIPHGGGGPGVGPIGVAAHLCDFLPGHSNLENQTPTGPVTSAPYGSASILPISWGYLHMMGSNGVKEATQFAILGANYIAERLKNYYPILYTGQNNRVAHECIIDVRGFKATAGVSVDDIAKRLMDYGFHAPTMSWPVIGTLMIEPTESENKEELDRFIESMISIYHEIKMIESGEYPKEDNPLVNAPHTVDSLVSDEWNHSYSREVAVFPKKFVKHKKFWPAVSRVDNVYGDRNLSCSCPPLEDYM